MACLKTNCWVPPSEFLIEFLEYNMKIYISYQIPHSCWCCCSQGHFFCVAPVYTAFHMKDYLFVLCLPVNWIVLPPQYPCKGPSSRYTLDFPISYSSSLKYNQLLPFLPKFSTRGWIHFSKLSFHNFLGLSFPIFKTEGVGLDEFCIWPSSLITF